ncbi:MAG: rRNA pseudouridine synthase, partial [Gemmatimonadota bacterium]
MTSVAKARREPIRLQKYLSRAGIASRREGERLIAAGRVSVDGAIVTEMGTRVVPGEQVVCVDGQPLVLRSARWIALYKPAGYLTTRRDEHGRSTVYSLLPAGDEDLFHVGRLDRETEGLLILTNDGEPAHR